MSYLGHINDPYKPWAPTHPLSTIILDHLEPISGLDTVPISCFESTYTRLSNTFGPSKIDFTIEDLYAWWIREGRSICQANKTLKHYSLNPSVNPGPNQFDPYYSNSFPNAHSIHQHNHLPTYNMPVVNNIHQTGLAQVVGATQQTLSFGTTHLLEDPLQGTQPLNHPVPSPTFGNLPVDNPICHQGSATLSFNNTPLVEMRENLRDQFSTHPSHNHLHFDLNRSGNRSEVHSDTVHTPGPDFRLHSFAGSNRADSRESVPRSLNRSPPLSSVSVAPTDTPLTTYSMITPSTGPTPSLVDCDYMDDHGHSIDSNQGPREGGLMEEKEEGEEEEEEGEDERSDNGLHILSDNNEEDNDSTDGNSDDNGDGDDDKKDDDDKGDKDKDNVKTSDSRNDKRSRLFRKRRASPLETALYIYSREANINWHKLTVERIKKLDGDHSRDKMKTHMQIVRDHWRELPEEAQHSYLERAKEELGNPQEDDLSQVCTKLRKKFKDDGIAARDDFGFATFMVFWPPEAMTVEQAYVIQHGFQNEPRFLDWLQKKSSKDAEVLKKWIVQYGVEHGLGGTDARLVTPQKTTALSMDVTSPTRLDFSQSTSVKQLRLLLRDSLKQRWYVTGRKNALSWKKIETAPHNYCDTRHLPTWWVYGDPTRLNRDRLLEMLNYLKDGDEGKLPEKEVFRWFETTPTVRPTMTSGDSTTRTSGVVQVSNPPVSDSGNNGLAIEKETAAQDDSLKDAAQSLPPQSGPPTLPSSQLHTDSVPSDVIASGVNHPCL
ncbi:hypothetical protein CPB86DRAFT_336987 [Serendipita vermifera]|nr:hypothetical protein CPB86DRAFT_336987 [Serendipita vermifera]